MALGDEIHHDARKIFPLALIPKRHKLIGVVVREDQDRKLDHEARNAGKTRSEVIKDLLDRHFSIVPDIEIPTPGLNHRK